MMSVIGRSRLSGALLFFVAAVLFLGVGIQQVESSIEGKIIGGWAETFGDELFELGKRITKAPEIKARYKQLSVRVEKKDGKQLLRSAVETIGRMLSRKMDAIRCIQNKSEELSESFEYNDTDYSYFSSKYSQVEGEDPPVIPEALIKNAPIYRNMSLNSDTHFYNISVNTEYSTVHVPTNVYDKGKKVQETIMWSEELDKVFVQNYNSDPALSWQYFCSTTGILRQYPGVTWTQSDEHNQRSDVDLFDCRTRSWYIEAASCSKDVVILFDNSGSMAGYRKFVASFTVRAILETFSNNDFFNIFAFANETIETVPCFGDKLMQATPDNMRSFNEALVGLKPDGHANFTLAFIKAFELLEYYRLTRGCEDDAIGCNQAIMLITDGVPGNLTEVYERYNHLNNGTEIPVRIFTYLIGKEVTNVREIQWLACLNRGYYVHIQSLDEVRENVLKYISVIARPLVLQRQDHPITWTHAYTDITPSKRPLNAKYDTYRLMISVAIPLYDLKVNNNNETRMANLLGVAGTDVPIEEIDKLTLPYKLGVNGYSFIVSNNGYLILHPDLRPVYKGILKENYNSVDVVEVETMDDGLGIHELGDVVKEIRNSIVNATEGSMMNVKIRFHYDKMRRVSRERQDYYFAPLPNTSFALGIVLPHDYGNTWIKVGDEVKRNQHLGLKIEDFFTGDNWKIHKKWVYCNYHYLEGHEYQTPEAELLHFLRKMSEPDWKWSEQYEPEPEIENDDDELNCGRKSLDDDAYFCNKELVQLLVFDAKVTDPLYKIWEFKDDAEEQLFKRYNASLRFAATMSGLTRWQFVFGEDMNDTDSEFGDYFSEAIDETWYKSAILQHQIEAESFVFSVPFDSGSKSDEDVIVTASHAVFPRDGGLQAPSAVLGYQFSHKLMYDRFMEITSEVKLCDGCVETCASEVHDCYVIDSSGYVIISENHNETGKFFGEVQGHIMESMINADVFQKMNVFDLQGVCFHNVPKKSDGANMINATRNGYAVDALATPALQAMRYLQNYVPYANLLMKLSLPDVSLAYAVNSSHAGVTIAVKYFEPFQYVGLMLQWIGAQLIWLLVQTHLALMWGDSGAYSMHFEDDDYYDSNYDEIGGDFGGGFEKTTPKPHRMRKGFDEEEEEFFNRPQVQVMVKKSFPCDRLADLYVLQQEMLINGDGFIANGPSGDTRPYYVKRIPNSNLLMIVINTMHRTKERKMHAGARPLIQNGTIGAGASCHKLQLADLPRRRLEGCYTYDPLEFEVQMCGRSVNVKMSWFVMTISWILLTCRRMLN